MYGGAVSWSGKKQASDAASTMEAEYQACGAVALEALVKYSSHSTAYYMWSTVPYITCTPQHSESAACGA
jgi:hypothetical protein